MFASKRCVCPTLVPLVSSIEAATRTWLPSSATAPPKRSLSVTVGSSNVWTNEPVVVLEQVCLANIVAVTVVARCSD